MRLITAFNFIVLSALFFLPWIDVRCEGPNMAAAMGGAQGAPAIPGMGGGAEGSKLSVCQQSGFEAATGEISESDDIKKLKAMGGGKKNPGAGGVDDPFKGKKSQSTAPLLFAYIGLLVVGVAVSLVVPAGKAWKRGVFLCAALALVVLGAQTAMGFPVANDLQKQFDDPVGGMALGGAGMPGLKITTAFKIPYFLSWVLGATCLLCAVLAPMPNKPRTVQTDIDDDVPPK